VEEGKKKNWLWKAGTSLLSINTPIAYMSNWVPIRPPRSGRPCKSWWQGFADGGENRSLFHRWIKKQLRPFEFMKCDELSFTRQEFLRK